jgi:flagellar hook assembly protein FlgD
MIDRDFSEQLEILHNLRYFISPAALKLDEEKANKMLTKVMSSSPIPGLIGKIAKAQSDKFYFNGINPVNIIFNIGEKFKSVELIISDRMGNIITVKKQKNIEFGENHISWNGINNKRKKSTLGYYNIILKAKDINNSIVNLKTYLVGNIQKMIFSEVGTSVLIDNILIPYDKITYIKFLDI